MTHIEKCEEVDFNSKEEVYELYSWFNKRYSNLESFSLLLREEPKRFYRARANDDSLFKDIKELWYPERPRVQRCNFDSRPAFYCSNELATTLFEMKPDVGGVYTVIEVNHQVKELEIGVLGGLIGNIPNVHMLSNDGIELNLALEKLFRSEIIESDRKKYYQTAIPALAVLQHFGILAYPSVGAKCRGWNLVMSTEHANNNLRFNRAYVFKVEGITSESIIVNYLYEAQELNDKSEFVWEETLKTVCLKV